MAFVRMLHFIWIIAIETWIWGVHTLIVTLKDEYFWHYFFHLSKKNLTRVAHFNAVESYYYYMNIIARRIQRSPDFMNNSEWFGQYLGQHVKKLDAIRKEVICMFLIFLLFNKSHSFIFCPKNNKQQVIACGNSNKKKNIDYDWNFLNKIKQFGII